MDGQYALRLNGTNAYIEIPDHPSLRVSYITVEAWVKHNGKDDSLILNKENDYEFRIQSNGLVQWALSAVGRPNWSWFNSGASVPRNQWTHVAVVYNGQRVFTYINGELKGNVSFPYGELNKRTRVLMIGNRESGSSSFFGGDIDEVRIWNYPRSAEEIRENYTKVLIGDEDGLVGYWRLDEGLGSIVYDYTVFENNGTIVGEAEWIPAGVDLKRGIGISLLSEKVDLVDRGKDYLLQFDIKQNSPRERVSLLSRKTHEETGIEYYRTEVDKRNWTSLIGLREVR